MLSVTVDGTGDHSTYIVFAPYENPEIAISVILEHGSSGYSAGTVVKEMLDAYFFSNASTTPQTPPYFVLG